MAARAILAVTCVLFLRAGLRADTNTAVQPAYFISEASWMDRSQQWATSNLHQRVVWFDSLFQIEGAVDPVESRFRVGAYMLFDPRGTWGSPEADFTFSGHVDLPRLREKLRLVLDSRDMEALPGSRPDEQREEFRLALRRVGDWVDIDLGVKVKTSPVVYVKTGGDLAWQAAGLRWRLGQSFFYQNDTGFGEVTALTQHRWLGPRLLLGHASAARWTEASQGLEWEDTLGLLRVALLRTEDHRGHFVGSKDIARGYGMRLGINGHHDGHTVVDRYRATAFWRRPLGAKDWCFIEISPEVEWKKEDRWQEEYVLRIGLDILFHHDR